MTTQGHRRVGVTHNRALCCTCGQTRTVAANFTPRQHIPDVPANDPDHFAEIQGRGGYADGEWGFRKTGQLKCANCGTTTRHAILRDCDKPEYRDYAEVCDYRAERAQPAPPRSTSVLAVNHIIDVEDLGTPAMIVRTKGPTLLLLDTELEHDERMKILKGFLERRDAE